MNIYIVLKINKSMQQYGFDVIFQKSDFITLTNITILQL